MLFHFNIIFILVSTFDPQWRKLLAIDKACMLTTVIPFPMSINDKNVYRVSSFHRWLNQTRYQTRYHIYKPVILSGGFLHISLLKQRGELEAVIVVSRLK